MFWMGVFADVEESLLVISTGYAYWDTVMLTRQLAQVLGLSGLSLGRTLVNLSSSKVTTSPTCGESGSVLPAH